LFRFYAHILLVFNINQRKKGDPIALVINPIGNSAGWTIVLEIRSEMTIKIAPPRAELGSK